jgi:glycine/D-amino acid oxidase-like deaminating enzyme
MELSYWEIKTWLSRLDYCVVGSGITGLSCALELRQRYPDARILVLERGVFPHGASTRNAGFACFGSLTEILADLETHSEQEVVELVSDRWSGIQLLRSRLGDTAMGYRQWGGYEVFLEGEAPTLERCRDEMGRINALLHPVFGQDAFRTAENSFGFRGVLPTLLLNPLEGQIDTGSTMDALLDKVRRQVNPVMLVNGVRLEGYEDGEQGVRIQTSHFEFRAARLLIATNGFAAELDDLPVAPARAQVVVTEPIPGLGLRGTFHMEEGYYYFRNVGDRVLLGGGRNLDKAGETTTEFGQTALIQDRLATLLEEVIVPGRPLRIAHRWSGIMGVGPQKRPVVKRLSENVACGVRLGGMGVAIGSHVGRQLALLAGR